MLDSLNPPAQADVALLGSTIFLQPIPNDSFQHTPPDRPVSGMPFAIGFLQRTQATHSQPPGPDGPPLLTHTKEVAMTHTTSKFLRAGLTSLILGLGALSLTAGSAFALQVSASDTQTTFTIMEQSGPFNGVDDKVYTEFDFSGVDWNTVTLNSAMLELHLTIGKGLTKSDEILFGSEVNGGGTDLVSSILGGVDLFDQTGLGAGTLNPLSFGLPVPSPGDNLVLNLDLNEFWDNADLQSALLGGDSLGKIYMKYSDDALVTSATLTLGYDDPSLDEPDNNCIDNCGPTPNPVPEPSTMILLGSGLMGLVAWRKRHQG